MQPNVIPKASPHRQFVLQDPPPLRRPHVPECHRPSDECGSLRTGIAAGRNAERYEEAQYEDRRDLVFEVGERGKRE